MEFVKWIVLDVDGTLTDGGVHFDDAGREHKHFHVADGLGIVMAQAVGLQVAVISGRQSVIVDRRMAELKVKHVLQGVGDKAAKLHRLMQDYALQPQEVAFVGDDLNDLPAFEVVGVKIAVANAARIVRERADYVTARPGGQGAVRDAIDEILRRQQRTEEALAAYLEHITQDGAGTRQ